jgi:ABC-type enterochelin transport system permease subunit
MFASHTDIAATAVGIAILIIFFSMVVVIRQRQK